MGKSLSFSLAIATIWIVFVVIVDPVGDFPLNDDWSFGLTVQTLLHEGDFRPNGWASMTQVTNTAWGALFCWPVGFSFTALRVSTLAAALLGAFASRWLLPAGQIRERWSPVVMATILFNPVFFALSFSFMTDVLFAALVVLGLGFFLRALRDDAATSLIVGTVVAVLATLSRQIGLALPLAFAVTCLLSKPMSPLRLARALLPLLVCGVALFVFERWMDATGRTPAAYNLQGKTLQHVLQFPGKAVADAIKNADEFVIYLGLFLLPVELVVGLSVWRAHRRFFAVVFPVCLMGLLAALIPFYVAGHTLTMPMIGNVIVPSGVGPLTLSDTYFGRPTDVPGLSRIFWIVVTIASTLGGAFFATFNVLVARDLAWAIRDRVLRRKFADETGLFYVYSIASIALLLLIGFYDRYFLAVLPAFAALFCRYGIPSREPIGLRLSAAVICVFLAAYAVGGTHDYLAWNRARWAALEALERQGVSVAAIDGGFEYNGLRAYRPDFVPVAGKSWWWVTDDQFLISFAEVAGFRPIGSVGYRRLLPPREDKLLVLQRMP